MLAVTVIGNIGNDAEIKEFNGQKFIAFNVASTERYKDRQGNQHSRTTWVSCLKPGESSVVTYLKKGTQVYVRGSLSVKTFNSGNGVQAGEKTKERGFFCMKLLAFLNTEAEPGTEAYAELWEQRFNEAKLGACAYRGKCPIYARTAKKGIQQNLFAQL